MTATGRHRRNWSPAVAGTLDAAAALAGVVLAGVVLAGVVLAGCGDGGSSERAGGPVRATASASSAAASGSDLARVDLTGQVVVLDPGHNGGDADASAVIGQKVKAGGFDKECDTAGAATATGYPEHAFTFDVATRAARLLRARGATVYLTRLNDTGVGPCVDTRAAFADDLHAAAAVSIHADGGPDSGLGFHVIAPARSPDGANAAILGPSARLGRDVHDRFRARTGERDSTYVAAAAGGRVVSRSDLAGLNLSRVPKIFVECLNMRNRADAARAVVPAWRQRAAAGIADGITAYLSAPGS